MARKPLLREQEVYISGVAEGVSIGGVTDVTDPSTPTAISEIWRIAYRYDEDTGNSDKVIVVPFNEEWQVQWVWVEYTSDGTAGDRRIELQVLDSSNDVLARFVSGVLQAASLTYHYVFGPIVDQTAVRDGDHVTVATLPIWLAEGWSLRIWDNKAISPDADDMIVQIPIAFRAT